MLRNRFLQLQIDQIPEALKALLANLGRHCSYQPQTAKRLRALAGGEPLKIIALTGWGKIEDQARIRAAGFDSHLVRPVTSNGAARLGDLKPAIDVLHSFVEQAPAWP